MSTLTTTKTPKAAQASKSANSDSITTQAAKPRKARAPKLVIRVNPDIARRIARLSNQLGFEMETIAERCLDMSTREIDWNLSQDVHPFSNTTADEFDATAAMDSLTVSAIAKLEADGDFAQAVLYDMDCEARGIRRWWED